MAEVTDALQAEGKVTIAGVDAVEIIPSDMQSALAMLKRPGRRREEKKEPWLSSESRVTASGCGVPGSSTKAAAASCQRRW